MKCLKAAGRGPALRPIGDATGGCILETLGCMGGMVKGGVGDGTAGATGTAGTAGTTRLRLARDGSPSREGAVTGLTLLTDAGMLKKGVGWRDL